MSRAPRGAAAALCAALLAALLALPASTPADAAPSRRGVGLTLRSQPAWASTGDDVPFGLSVRGDLGGLELRAVIHTYITTRAGFERATTGSRLGGVVGTTAVPTGAAGPTVLTVPLQDPALPRAVERVRVPLPRGGRAGVFPIELEVRDPDTGERFASLVTFLTIVSPLSGGPAVAEPLRVAWVWPLAERAPVSPGGGPSAGLTRAVAPGGRLARIAAALPDADGEPITLDADPATIQTWSRVAEEADAPVGFDRVRSAFGAQPHLEAPFVPIDLPAFAAAGLGDLAGSEWAGGAEAIRRATGTDASVRIVRAAPLDGPAIGDLRTRGVTQLLVPSGSLVTNVVPNLTPARPFTLSSGNASLPAAQIDDGLSALFERPGSPALRAARLLGGLSVVALELPSQRRGLVVAGSRGWRPTTDALDAVLTGLQANPVLLPVTAANLFEDVPAERVNGRPVVRRPSAPGAPRLPVPAAALRATLARVDAFRAFAGDGEATFTATQHLLLSPSSRAGRTEGRAQLRAANATMDAFIAQVRAPVSRTLRVTARRAQVPLSFQNDTGQPLQVRLRLRSDRLEFPEGDDRIIDLPPNNTTVQITVVSRSSGSFPLTLSITSVDGRVLIERSRVTVRSSIVSGFGIALTVAAALFLLGWWLTHWRRSRRTPTAVVEP